MSIEANTFEELKIINCNEKTAGLAAAVGEYLIKTWSINDLTLNVDGAEYVYSDDAIEEGIELYSICQKLGDAKKLSLALRSCNNGGASWRKESCFMALLTDDDELKTNVTYRSIDYYDTDSFVDVYLYDKNGLTKPEYNKTADDIADIESWYCCTPEFAFTTGETENEEMHEKVLEAMQKFANCLIDCDFEDMLDDCFEDGEMYVNGSFAFATKSISDIEKILSELVNDLKNYESTELEVAIDAVPYGENDYNFAVASITVADGTVSTRYCKF